MVDRRRPNRITYRLRSRRDVRMTITVIGASIGAQFSNGDPNRYEWRGGYEKDGRGLYYHTVSSRDAQDSRGASKGQSTISVSSTIAPRFLATPPQPCRPQPVAPIAPHYATRKSHPHRH